MKIKKAKAAKPATRKMPDDEIKEAIKRDKEWMNRIDPDDAVPKDMLKDIFNDIMKRTDDDVEDEDDSEDLETEVFGDDEDAIDVDAEVADDDDDDDDDVDSVGGGGKMVGALLGGIGGLVLGSVLGAAVFGDA